MLPFQKGAQPPAIIYGTDAIWLPPADTLFSTGNFANGNSTCSGDSGNASVLDTASGANTFGYGHALSSGFRVADDFVVPPGETWTLSNAYFFAYQTGSTTTSTINNVNVRLWDGPPNAGGTVVCGDTSTNAMAATEFSGIFRVTDTALGTCTRPVMVQRVNLSGCPSLGAGTYWLDWQTGGTLASGPWAPPLAIAGGGVTGNALQFDPGAAAWNPMVDTNGTGSQEGLPFVVAGSNGPPVPTITINTGAATVADQCASNPSQSNGVVEPGETVNITVPVSVSGGDFTNVVASLDMPAPAGITYLTASSPLGDLDDGDSANAMFSVRVDAGFVCLTDFTLGITVNSDQGSANGSLDIDVGAPGAQVPADTPVSIPDNSPAGANSIIDVTQSFTLSGLSVRVNIPHTWVGDLRITLTSPSNTTITLLDRPGVPASVNGCNNNNITATFTDGEPDPESICDVPGGTNALWPVTTAGPVQPLSTFNGENVQGAWRLNVSDHAGLDTGQIVDWELIPTPAFEKQCSICGDDDIIFQDGFEGL